MKQNDSNSNPKLLGNSGLQSVTSVSVTHGDGGQSASSVTVCALAQYYTPY